MTAERDQVPLLVIDTAANAMPGPRDIDMLANTTWPLRRCLPLLHV